MTRTKRVMIQVQYRKNFNAKRNNLDPNDLERKSIVHLRYTLNSLLHTMFHDLYYF